MREGRRSHTLDVAATDDFAGLERCVQRSSPYRRCAELEEDRAADGAVGDADLGAGHRAVSNSLRITSVSGQVMS
jgi:hypothetical protein